MSIDEIGKASKAPCKRCGSFYVEAAESFTQQTACAELVGYCAQCAESFAIVWPVMLVSENLEVRRFLSSFISRLFSLRFLLSVVTFYFTSLFVSYFSVLVGVVPILAFVMVPQLWAKTLICGGSGIVLLIAFCEGLMLLYAMAASKFLHGPKLEAERLRSNIRLTPKITCAVVVLCVVIFLLALATAVGSASTPGIAMPIWVGFRVVLLGLYVSMWSVVGVVLPSLALEEEPGWSDWSWYVRELLQKRIDFFLVIHSVPLLLICLNPLLLVLFIALAFPLLIIVQTAIFLSIANRGRDSKLVVLRQSFQQRDYIAELSRLATQNEGLQS